MFLDLKTRVGVDRSATVFFEYGMGKSNCQEFRRVRSMETSATRVYVLGTGQTVVAEAYDAQTTITKAMLPLLKNLVLLGGFEFIRHRFEDAVRAGNVTLVQVRRP